MSVDNVENEIFEIIKEFRKEVDLNKSEIKKLKSENKEKDEKIKKLEEKLEKQNKDTNKLAEKTVEVIEHFDEKCYILKQILNDKIGEIESLKKESKDLESKCKVLARRYLNLFDDSEEKIGKQNEAINKLKCANAVTNKNFEYVEKELLNLRSQVKNLKIGLSKIEKEKEKNQ